MSTTTLQDLLYQLGQTEARLAELQIELQNTRAKLAEQRERARRHLDRLEAHEEAYEAYGRAYWLDDRGSVASMRIRPSYDVMLEPAAVSAAVEPTRDFA